MSKILEVQGLSKYYGKKMALDNINFAVEEGEIMGFIGPNGAGKTTTINILMNFIFPNSGSAKIFGKSVLHESHLIKQDLGFMASDDFLYSQDSAWKNLKYIAELKGIRSANDTILHYAELLDLDLKQKVRKLSKGNKRKVSLLAALLSRPRLLIMDEMTVGLDPVVKAKTFDLLRELNQKHHCSIFFSSHVLSEVEELCHRTAFIKQGQIIKLDQVSAIGDIHYSIRCDNPENFQKLELFLQGHSSIQALVLDFPSIQFHAQDSKLTHELEAAQLFRLMDKIELRRSSLEQSLRSNYL